ncbi:hypothetical protein EV361DRAFT_869847 [Lentinula raphanica]|nr:hypothetical protein EV361DRAFT_869847 [Lentinula raphanica]
MLSTGYHALKTWANQQPHVNRSNRSILQNLHGTSADPGVWGSWVTAIVFLAESLTCARLLAAQTRVFLEIIYLKLVLVLVEKQYIVLGLEYPDYRCVCKSLALFPRRKKLKAPDGQVTTGPDSKRRQLARQASKFELIQGPVSSLIGVKSPYSTRNSTCKGKIEVKLTKFVHQQLEHNKCTSNKNLTGSHGTLRYEEHYYVKMSSMGPVKYSDNSRDHARKYWDRTDNVGTLPPRLVVLKSESDGLMDQREVRGVFEVPARDFYLVYGWQADNRLGICGLSTLSSMISNLDSPLGQKDFGPEKKVTGTGQIFSKGNLFSEVKNLEQSSYSFRKTDPEDPKKTLQQSRKVQLKERCFWKTFDDQRNFPIRDKQIASAEHNIPYVRTIDRLGLVEDSKKFCKVVNEPKGKQSYKSIKCSDKTRRLR